MEHPIVVLTLFYTLAVRGNPDQILVTFVAAASF